MEQPLGVFDYKNEEYHASQGISRSSLWLFKNLPYKFWYEKLSGEYTPKEDKDSFVLGNLVHTMTLEPDKIKDNYIISPDIDRRTKEGRLEYLDFIEKSEGRTIVKLDTWVQATEMCVSLNKNTTVRDLIVDSVVEKSIYWKHEGTGIICKARPDVWQGTIVSDLKTTQDASHRSFQSSAYKYGYYLQAAMIYEALKSIGEPFHNFVFICVEKTPPYCVALYLLDEEALQFGLDQFNYLITKYAECKEKNVWPDYGIQKLTLPRYANLEESEYE